MTPCELWTAHAGAALRQRDQFERDTTLAWQVVKVYVRTMNDKQMPTLASLVTPSAGRQTVDDHKAALSTIFGRRTTTRKQA